MPEEGRESIDLWSHERAALARGHRVVAGVDEAGRGPLAGPVVAAAVILPFGCDVEGIFDSKQLTPRQREDSYRKIRATALSIGTGVVGPGEIDRINVLRATYRAMRLAIRQLSVEPDFVLADGYPIRNFEYPHLGIVSGDCKSACIAAASIVAKITRDRIMCEYDALYPQYGFAKHKGYPTPEHIENLARHGVCDIHRKSFRPVAKELESFWERKEPPWAGGAKDEPSGI